MPSRALTTWQSDGRRALDEMEAAHRAVGRTGAGSRFAAQQINQAYVLLLSARFQCFCRDLHTECVDHVVSTVASPLVQIILQRQLMNARKLDSGNPNPGNLGSDFERFELSFWPMVLSGDKQNHSRQRLLMTMNRWRNAIAHQNFSHRDLAGRNQLRPGEVRLWRNACEHLAVDFDYVMYHYLDAITGIPPW